MLESGICGLLEAETTLSSKTLLVGCLSVCLSAGFVLAYKQGMDVCCWSYCRATFHTGFCGIPAA